MNFQNNTNNQNVSPRRISELKYTSARNNLLLMIILTAVNMILVAVSANVTMLFSATVPYYSFILGINDQSKVFTPFFVAFSLICLAAYVICWVFSKKHFGWMIAALVMFSLDTLFLIGLYILLGDAFGILDTLIHVWVLYYLIVGVINGVKLKKLPEEEQEIITIEEENNDIHDDNASETSDESNKD